MKAFIFTHKPDYPLAEMATAALGRLGVRTTWVVDMGDAVPEAKPPLVFTSTPRHGCLNGIKWVITQLETMLFHADDAEWILKVDSDTMVLSLGWLRGVQQDCEACGVYSISRELYGCCYALKASIIPRMLKAAEDWGQFDSIHGEDLIVAKLLDKCGASNIRHPYHSKHGALGFWCGDRKDPGPHEIICVQREMVTRRGHERDKVIESMRKISETASIK